MDTPYTNFKDNDNNANTQSQQKINEIKDQIKETTALMKQNIDATLKRGEDLKSLEAKTEDLQNSSVSFHRVTKQVRRTMCWKNVKMTICIILILLIIIGIIVAIIYGRVSSGDNNNN